MALAPSHRLESVDALRGVAVLLMIQQHVLFWLSSNISTSALVLGLGGLGGLAAPIFITLAGVGSSLGTHRHADSDRIMPIRGLMILGFGYVLNFLAPHWFTLGAWYVLHLIGIAVMLSPLLQRISSPYLLTLTAIVIVATAVLQTYLGTPFRLFNQQMSDPVNVYGFLRHIFAEGFFPIFPWLAYFIAGMVSGRWLSQKEKTKIGYLAAVLFGLFLILALLDAAAPPFTQNPYLIRFFTVIPTFYPSLTPIILLLISLSLFFLLGFTALEEKTKLRSVKFLSCLGQCSMTLLIVHVAVIRGAAHHFHFWQTFPVAEAVLLTLITLLAFTLIACQWRKVGYRYGTEWLLRKVSQKSA